MNRPPGSECVSRDYVSVDPDPLEIFTDPDRSGTPDKILNSRPVTAGHLAGQVTNVSGPIEYLA
jgi:hypothetical protein